MNIAMGCADPETVFEPRHPDDASLLRQPALFEEQVQRRNELAAGEVAGSAEDDNGMRHG
jgi:hypothetical protein